MDDRLQKEQRVRAALEVAARSADGFRRTAGRYSLCASDAEDAYQRGLEILLTKAPSCDPEQLHPWLHTVIKHEALALRRQRERLLGAELTNAGTVSGPDELAPERERARHTAEALGGLKHSEIQCMLLKALGYSYDEIAARTGYSWTKVNRSLSEGRKQFFEQLDEIRSGTACDGLEPRITVAARQPVPAAERQGLDAHLASCGSCRARLRKLRSASGHALLAPVALLAGLRGRAAFHDRVVGLADRLASLVEPIGAHKVAAVAASTAALAGGVATEAELHSHGARRASVRQVSAQAVPRASDRAAIAQVSAPSGGVDRDPDRDGAPLTQRETPPVVPSREFGPAADRRVEEALDRVPPTAHTAKRSHPAKSNASSGREFTP